MKPDSDLVLHISVNVPGACKNQVNKMEANMKKDPSSVTIELVHEKLNSRYTRIPKLCETAPGSDHEKTRLAVSQNLAAMSEE